MNADRPHPTSFYLQINSNKMKKHLLSETIKNATHQLEEIKDDVAVFLVLNTKGTTEVTEDYEEHSTTTEFFSQKEAEEFIGGFIKLGIYHEVYNGEKEFVDKLSSGYIENLPFSHKIVYSSTGVGLARSKSALVPALCNLYQIGYCSNDIYTAAFLENKVHVLNILEHYGFPLPKYWVYDSVSGWLKGEEPSLHIKLISKPAYECASTGISEDSVSLYNEQYMKHIHNLSVIYKQPVIVEAFIAGYEVEVPVFDCQEPICAIAVGIKENGNSCLGNSFLTYDKVADDRYEFYNFDEQNPKIASELKQTAIKTFKTLGLSGVLRVDFRVQENGEFFIMDYNNSPHLTANHSCAFSILQLGFEFEDMLKLVLYKSLGLEAKKLNSNLSVSDNALNN